MAMSPTVRFWSRYSHSTHLSMGLSLKKSKFPFGYQKMLSVSDPVNLLSTTEQPTGGLDMIDTVLLGLNSPWSLLGSGGAQWLQSRSPGQRSCNILLVHIAGFSAHSCGGEVGSAVVGAIGSENPQTQQDSGYTQAITMHGDARKGAKQPHCGYCRRGGSMLEQKSEGSTPARLFCHLKYVLSLQTGAASYSVFRFHVNALERQFLPLHPFPTYQMLHLCSPWSTSLVTGLQLDCTPQAGSCFQCTLLSIYLVHISSVEWCQKI